MGMNMTGAVIAHTFDSDLSTLMTSLNLDYEMVDDEAYFAEISDDELPNGEIAVVFLEHGVSLLFHFGLATRFSIPENYHYLIYDYESVSMSFYIRYCMPTEGIYFEMNETMGKRSMISGTIPDSLSQLTADELIFHLRDKVIQQNHQGIDPEMDCQIVKLK